MSDCLRPKSQGQELLEVSAETQSKFFRDLVHSFQIELNTHTQKETFQVTLDFLQVCAWVLPQTRAFAQLQG